jgi:hypothetical protein
MTPAALLALVGIRDGGDIENLIAAAMPGGIEAQEARGQRDLCATERLPKDGFDSHDLSQIGIEKLGDADDIFYSVRLPAGWKIKPTEHSMWNQLVDEQGRERASIFYKAAFYDRKAHMRLTSRYTYDVVYCNARGEPAYDGNKRLFEPTHEKRVIRDGNVVLHETMPLEDLDYLKSSNQERQAYWGNQKAMDEYCRQWLDVRYPDWQNPLAYWDAPAEPKQQEA